MTEAGVDLSQASADLIDAFNDADWERFRGVLSPDTVYSETGTGRRVEGAEAYVTLCQGWKVALPDVRGTIRGAIATKDQVAQEILWEGTHTGPMETPGGTLPPSGGRTGRGGGARPAVPRTQTRPWRSDRDGLCGRGARIDRDESRFERTLDARDAKVINKKDVAKDVVSVGSKVKLRDVTAKQTVEYHIVGSAEANPTQNKLSNESPVGKAIIGHKKGETVEVTAPRGAMK